MRTKSLLVPVLMIALASEFGYGLQEIRGAGGRRAGARLVGPLRRRSFQRRVPGRDLDGCRRRPHGLGGPGHLDEAGTTRTSSSISSS
ncbi:MAG: hypothetical protein MZV64_43805 [Ignavibacteriales bacterium]|nr:hypothetical protein [Ignavibacteriales bacterium]